jgi:hypothetical protein
MAALVMRMGRMRAGPAWRMASWGVHPSSRTLVTAWSTRRMPFFVTRPIKRMSPMVAPMDMELPWRNSAMKAPTNAIGIDIMIEMGWMKDSNCEASTK